VVSARHYAHCGTLVELCRSRAESTLGSRAGYTYLSHGDTESESLTYRDVHTRARAVAAAIRDHAAVGDRALLLVPPGTDFTVAFFGCQYAGVIAVPAAPPHRKSADDMSRLAAIVANARPALVIGTSSQSGLLATFDGARMPPLPALVIEDVDGARADDWRAPTIGEDSIAYLQYSSGSTAAPRGVRITHRNVLHGLAAISRMFQMTEADSGVLWLPTFHDMGLVGCTLQPMYEGGRVWVMSPVSFLQRPMRWLTAMSRLGGTMACGPNFAYDLCVKRSTPEQREALDLSRWRVAISGAEPVRRDTVEAFSSAFGPCGFRREAFSPSYGLAEATLLVTGRSCDRPLTMLDVDQEELGLGRVVTPPGPGAPARSLVGCGLPAASLEVVIVDVPSGRPLGEREVGEVWVAGDSVGSGYWANPEQSERTFGARCEGRRTSFMRTGDLGFLLAGELFLTGRMKDTIVIAGRNHDPEDIEVTLQQAHPAIARCAVFSVDAGDREHVVVVGELSRRPRGAAGPAELPPGGDMLTAVRQSVASRHGLQVHDWVAVRHGTLPLTTSGKIQRHECRARYLAGRLDRAPAAEPAPTGTRS
jgi:acyl-CoA synthetase (AMP-forming)/AMP-acid ligase II